MPGYKYFKIRHPLWRCCFERLPVAIPDRTVTPAEISGGYTVITAVMYLQPASGIRSRILIMKKIKTVPPIQMIFSKIWFKGKTRRFPISGYHHVTFHGGHAAVGPACTANLAFDRSYIIFSANI